MKETSREVRLRKRKIREEHKIRKQAKALQIKTKGLYPYTVQKGCGCCQDVLYFASDAAILAQFNKIGLTSSATIVDEIGQKVDGIDTFYGFQKGKKAELRSLDFLIKQLGKNK